MNCRVDVRTQDKRVSRREPPRPITATVNRTCHVTGLGRTTIYQLIGSGKLKTTTVGRRRLVSYASIEALVDAS
jgi:excisionase family DNA binding protein